MPMNFRIQQAFAPLLRSAPIWLIFLLGFWLIALIPLGLHWEFVPGDLGDGRFNNYVLEHFYLWITGQVPSSSYWNAPFFYPFLNVTAFSDNLLGSAPIYALFRWFGLDRETAFQCWYLCNFPLNYIAAAYVLSRAKLRPLAVGVGAFFFAFGAPVLAQGAHFQLYYRFGVPLACYFFLAFFNQPKLTRLIAVAFWVVWQFYLSIYLGLFLLMLLAALALLMPFFISDGIDTSIKARILAWPRKLRQAWLQTNLKESVLSLLVICALGICFFELIWPYYKISKDYGFCRGWAEVTSMLPIIQSFFLSDYTILWAPISRFFGQDIDVRHEHQLFPGIAIVIMVLVGLVGRFKSKNSHLAWLFLGSILILMMITLNFYGYSIYWLLWNIPGVNSIRAITRIQMVWLWPLAFFVSWVIDEVMAQKKSHLAQISVFFLTVLLITECIFFEQWKYIKADATLRLTELKQQLPATLPPQPILIVSNVSSPLYYMIELDAMLVAQELGWRTLNGYSGNNPPFFDVNSTCDKLNESIKRYTGWLHEKAKPKSLLRNEIVENIVMVGLHDCTFPMPR